MDKMTVEEAKAYLKRKRKEVSEENIAEIVQQGKIYGDPLVEIEW